MGDEREMMIGLIAIIAESGADHALAYARQINRDLYLFRL